MKNKFIQHTVFPLLAAMIWGSAFSAQKMVSGMGAITFNAARSAVAFVLLALGLLLVRAFSDRKRSSAGAEGAHPAAAPQEKRTHLRRLALAGLISGSLLTLATNLQQFGIETTSAGKASFITALYVVLVPLGSNLLFRHKVSLKLWLGIAVAVVGLYFISMQGDFSVAPGDLLVLACAFAFAMQMLSVEKLTEKLGGVELSCASFLVCAVENTILALIFEEPSLQNILPYLLPTLYVGVFSSAGGYTLQILSQKDGDTPVVTLLLSLESFFGALFGALILKERLSGRELFGCALMLIAVVLAELPERKKLS